MKNLKKTPQFYDCSNCKRTLAVERYKAQARPDPKHETVQVHYSPNYLPFTLMCTCGYYTVITDESPYKP